MLALIVTLVVLAALRDVPREELDRIRFRIFVDWVTVTHRDPEDFGREGLKLQLFVAGMFDRCVQ